MLLNRELYVGDVVTWVSKLRALKMYLADRADDAVTVVLDPTVQGHVGPTEEEIATRENHAGHQSAGQRADADLLVIGQGQGRRHRQRDLHIDRHLVIAHLVSGVQQEQVRPCLPHAVAVQIG